MSTMKVDSKQFQLPGNVSMMSFRSSVYRCPNLCKSYAISTALMSAPHVAVDGCVSSAIVAQGAAGTFSLEA